MTKIDPYSKFRDKLSLKKPYVDPKSFLMDKEGIMRFLKDD